MAGVLAEASKRIVSKRIVIVDDHPTTREGLRAVISRESPP